MELLNDMVWISVFFFTTDVIKDAILGDGPAILKTHPSDQAALEHSKSYYRSPISLLEHLVMWSPMLLGMLIYELLRQLFGNHDVVFDLIGFALYTLFVGLGVYLSLKIKTWGIRMLMRRFDGVASDADNARMVNRS